MIAFMLAAAGASPVPANPCNPAAACRYIEAVAVRNPDGGAALERKVGRWLQFVRGGALVLTPGEVVSVQLSDGGPVVTASARLAPEDHAHAGEERASRQQDYSDLTGGRTVGLIRKLDHNPLYAADANRLRIAFMQAEDGSDAMVLRITSGYRSPVTYKAQITVPGYTPQATTVCPVLASKTAFETWPNAIVQIELSDFTLREAGAAEACR
jgi:hypothetical protein